MKRLSAVVSEEEYGRVGRLVRAGAARSMADLVRTAVREYVQKMGSSKLLSLRNISTKQARSEVERYLRTHAGIVWPDKMAEELGIDYRVVLQVVKELTGEGKVEEVRVREAVMA